MLLETIQLDLKEAMHAKDENKVSALRFLLAQIYNKEIELKSKGALLTDDEVIGVIQKQVKERKESIEAFQKGMRDDLASKEKDELTLLSKYLPQQLSEDELKMMVLETISEMGATGSADFGRVMGAVMGKVKGKADGNQVAAMVKSFL